VVAGDAVGQVGALPIIASATGRLRGLTNAGARVEHGDKIVEVDPRGEQAQVHGLGERPLSIGRHAGDRRRPNLSGSAGRSIRASGRAARSAPDQSG